MKLAWTAIVVSVVANVIANLALTMGARGGIERGGGSLASIFWRPWTWVGLVAAVVLLAAYLYAIKHLPVSIVYAIVTSVSLLLVTACSVALFREMPSTLAALAMMLIIIGVALLGVAQMR